MEVVKRTANQRCQARSKSIISSVHQIKRLRPRETHQIAKTKTTSFGQTNNAPRSKTFTARQNAPNSKISNYIFRTNEQCSTKQNIYGPAERTKWQKPKLHLSDERTMPCEAKHLRPRKTHQIAKTKTTSFGRTNNAPRSTTRTAPRHAADRENTNYIFRTNEQGLAKHRNKHLLAQQLLQSIFARRTGVLETYVNDII